MKYFIQQLTSWTLKCLLPDMVGFSKRWDQNKNRYLCFRVWFWTTFQSPDGLRYRSDIHGILPPAFHRFSPTSLRWCVTQNFVSVISGAQFRRCRFSTVVLRTSWSTAPSYSGKVGSSAGSDVVMPSREQDGGLCISSHLPLSQQNLAIICRDGLDIFHCPNMKLLSNPVDNCPILTKRKKIILYLYYLPINLLSNMHSFYYMVKSPPLVEEIAYWAERSRLGPGELVYEHDVTKFLDFDTCPDAALYIA